MAPTFVHPVSASLFDAAPASPGIGARLRAALARFHARLVAARQAKAEREIARFIESRGGRLTDEVERQISQRFGQPAA